MFTAREKLFALPPAGPARLWLAALALVFAQFIATSHQHEHAPDYAADKLCHLCWHAQQLDISGVKAVSYQAPTIAYETSPILSIPAAAKPVQEVSARGPPLTFS